MSARLDKKKQIDLAANCIEWKRVLLLELNGLNYDRSLTQTSLKSQNTILLEGVLKFLACKLGFADAEHLEALEMLADWSNAFYTPIPAEIKDIHGWANFLCFAVWAAQLVKPDDLPADEWVSLPTLQRYLKGPVKQKALKVDEETEQLQEEIEIMLQTINDVEVPRAAEAELHELNQSINGLMIAANQADQLLNRKKAEIEGQQDALHKDLSTLYLDICSGFDMPSNQRSFDDNASIKLAQAKTTESDTAFLIELQTEAIAKAQAAALSSQVSKVNHTYELREKLADALQECEALKQSLHDLEGLVSDCQFEKDELDVESSALSFRFLDIVEHDLMEIGKHRELLVNH